MSTPILGIAEVSQSQSNKEVTINNAIRALEAAMQDTRTAAITAAHTVSAANFTGFFRQVFTGTFGATTVTVPNTKRLFYVQNDTNGILTVRAGSFALTAAVPVGKGRLLFCDGSDEVSEVSGAGGATDHTISFFAAGDGVDENKTLVYVFNKAVNYPTNITGSQGHAETVAASGPVLIDVQKNGASIGSISFAASTATCTFSITATNFVAGDRMSFVFPAAFNSLAGIAISILGAIP